MFSVRAFIFVGCGWLSLLSAATASDSPPGFTVCTDYHCDQTVNVKLENSQWQQIARMFRARTHPELERALIARAVALLEQYIGEQAGTSGDFAKNIMGAGLPGQLDCISESMNTTAYLNALMNAGLMRWHTVENRARRSSWIFNVHWTAVIKDQSTIQEFAVDSWFLANGQAPYVQALDAWFDNAPLPQNPDAGEQGTSAM